MSKFYCIINNYNILNIKGPIPLYLVYDDACHLKPFAEDRAREAKSERVAIFSKINYVVDKLHIKGHKGEICAQTVHPNLFPELDDVNTVVCEQTNFFVGHHKHALKHMNKVRYHFFLFVIFDMYNLIKIQGKFNLGNFIIKSSCKRKLDKVDSDCE